MIWFINPLPRKGTETSILTVASGIRKFINPLPRKGTETWFSVESKHFLLHFLLVFINPLPRKGTETVWVTATYFPVSFINPLPRKGTETSRCRS